MNVKKAAAIFLITIPIISAILIINFFTGVMSIPWQGMPVFFPLLLSPYRNHFSVRFNKDK